MPERSRAHARPRHLAQGGELPPWWRALDPRRLAVAVGATFLAAPVLVLDLLPERAVPAEAVLTAAPSSTSTTAAPTTTSTTAAPTTTASPPTTAAPATTTTPTPSTTARPRPVAVAAPTTVAAPPPTTAPPPPPPPPAASAPAGSVEEIIRAHFGAAGDQAVEVARCESGLNPRAQSPAGYRGLFQLDPSHAPSFQQVTGRDFDDAWDEADPNTQYARWLFDQRGWAPWGGCAP